MAICSDPVARFAEGVSSGQIIAGPLVRAACSRHLRDLREQQKRGIIWDAARATYVIGFFPAVLRLAGGDHEGKSFELQPWQQFIVGSLFGWLSTDGTRRFRVAYIEIGKGNGKSPLAAGIGLFLTVADKEPRAEVYSAATKEEQAQILFQDAVAMRDQSPKLAERLEKYGGAECWNLYDDKTGSFFRVVSSDGAQSGRRVHGGLIDEVHEHQNATVVDMMRAGTKGRRQALIIEITNSGFDRTTVCYAHHEYSQRVVEDVIDDDSWFAFVCGLDKDDDWKDEIHWLKANPNLGVSITHKYLREQVREAIGMPSKQSLVRRLNFCEWVDAASPWIDGNAWRSCEVEIDRAILKGKPSYGGLDLSGKNDLTALTIAIPDGEATVAISFFWTPSEGLRDREDRDRVPYATWRDAGYLEATPGRSIDYAFAAKRVADAIHEFGLKELAFDRYRIDDFCRELDELGVVYEVAQFGEDAKNKSALVLRPHGQGFQSMGPAVDELETSVLNRTLRVEKNPVMTMCSANAVLTMDPAGSRKFDKRPGKSTGRIDGVVSLAMAKRCAALAKQVEKHFWE